MMRTVGEYLDNPNEFFWWLNNSAAAFIVLNATVGSGFLEHLGDTPASIDELSTASGLPADKLGRLVSFLAAENVVALGADGRVAHTSRSRQLPRLKSALTCFTIYYEAGIPLHQALAKGVTSYEHRFGKPVFEHLGEQPETAAAFADFMGYLTGLSEDFVFTKHRFEPFSTAVDVGGSHGGLLLRLLAGHPDTSGVLFDLPEVAALFRDSVGQSPDGARVDVVGGSFFDSVPAGDLYLLKMILHDWNDEECVAILGSIRRAIAPDGRIAVIEHVMPETPRPHPANAMDIAMMVWATGRERKLSGFVALFDAAGFRFDRISENPLGWSVIEAVAA